MPTKYYITYDMKVLFVRCVIPCLFARCVYVQVSKMRRFFATNIAALKLSFLSCWEWNLSKELPFILRWSPIKLPTSFITA